MPGDEHDLRLRDQLRILEQVHAAAVGQLQVEQHDVGCLQRHLAPRLAQRMRGRDGEAFEGNESRQRFTRIDIVIDNQGVTHWCVLG